jgi:Tol biopolymer transport system component
VAFTSSASNLVAGDTNAKDDVFVVTVSSGAAVRASVASDGSQSTNHADETSLSADGSLLAFYSTASNLVVGDANGKGDVFVRDLVNGTTTRWSLTADGLEGNDRSANPTIAGDGRTVAFHSFATNLVPNDTNGVADVFVRGPDQ